MSECLARRFRIVLFITIIFFFLSSPLIAQVPFDGEGTAESPYLIEDAEDLVEFRDMVNEGDSFNDTFFLQTTDIDLENEDWIPIGIYDEGLYFYGIYDGGGHLLSNLYIEDKEEKQEDYLGDNLALFGCLGGTVVNLGIESGQIEGGNCGSIAVSAVGERAAIMNCYNKASITGDSAGGIANSFIGGVLVLCWSDCDLTGNSVGGILSYGGDLKMYHCYSTTFPLAPPDVLQKTSGSLQETQLYGEDFASRLSRFAGLAQYLFANEKDVSLLQWQVDGNELTYSQSTGWIDFWGVINYWLLPAILLVFITVYCFLFHKVGKSQIYSVYGGRISAAAVVFGVVSIFLDTALIDKGLSVLNPANGLFLFMVNGVFLFCLAMIGRYTSFRISFQRQWIPLMALIGIVVVLELLQFNLVPIYDAQLYYGSLTKGIELFRLDLLTYIGAFVCWKWTQGLVLVITPLEFLMTGKIIGLYIHNIIITVVTLICFYWLLRRIFIKITPLMATLCSAVLMLFPYGLGLFTYLCMDWHTPLFLVWLICAYLKKNDFLIAFCGYLLAFNKVTGLIFYAFFLIFVVLLELLRDKEKPFFRRILDWWNWRRVILWVLPGVLFIPTFLWGDHFTIQNFYGTGIGSPFGLKCPRAIANTLLQSYVYGFRWLFLLLIVVTVVLFITKRRKLSGILHKDGGVLLGAVTISCLFILGILFYYHGDAECPRYTSLFNIFYALSLPFCLSMIFSKTNRRTIAAGIFTVLLLIQTYWTIDPSLILTSDRIDTGKKDIYKLTMPNDIRPTMSLGIDYGAGIESLGDLYVYNLEYTYYSDLLEQVLEEINPQQDDYFYTLDVIPYELQLAGNHYEIYWNTRLQKRDFNGGDPDAVYLKNQGGIITAELCSVSKNECILADDFYLLVPARVDEEKAMNKLISLGYELTAEFYPENTYGSMSVYHFEKK